MQSFGGDKMQATHTHTQTAELEKVLSSDMGENILDWGKKR